MVIVIIIVFVFVVVVVVVVVVVAAVCARVFECFYFIHKFLSGGGERQAANCTSRGGEER